MFDIHKKAFDEDSGEIDWEHLDELIELFLASPEGKPFVSGAHWVPMMFEYALAYAGAEVAAMKPRDLEEVLFGLFPAKVSVEASAAPDIVAELRAFWQFVGREFALKNAPALAAMLDPRAAERLRKKLDDPANFGMAKSMFMTGQQAGFDMSSPEGMRAFVEAFNSRALPMMPVGDYEDDLDDIDDFGEAPGFRTESMTLAEGPTPKQRADQRARKRKAQKQSRKRNRK